MDGIHTATDDAETIIVASFAYCRTLNCTFGNSLHLLVWRCPVPLRSSETTASAISYTWGEFNRRKVEIGHDSKDKPISLELGIEWDTADFINSLNSICLRDSGHHACWIDQLCMPQEEESVRLTLARIPTIYKTLRVTVLMPGQPCECFFQNFNQILADKPMRSGRTQREYEYASENFQARISKCLNGYGACSYFERVWTRQEFFYSRRIRLLWTGREAGRVVRCAIEEDHLEHLSGFPKLLFQHYRDSRLEIPELALERVREFSNFFLTSMGRTLATYLGRPADDQSLFKMFDFVSGREMVRAEASDNQDPLSRFVSQLGKLGSENRRATQAHDYVVSVWVDCPGYVLPQGYKAMGLPKLLEDAITQLEMNWGVSLSTNAPQGLFRIEAGHSGLWRPTASMKREPSNTMDVYGVVQHPFQILPMDNICIVPLITFDIRGLFGLFFSQKSHEIRPYSALFQGQSSVGACNLLRRIIANWSQWVHERAQAFMAYEPRNTTEGSTDLSLIAVHYFQSILLRNGSLYSGRYLLEGDLSAEWANAKSEILGPDCDINHEEAVYELTTKALGLDLLNCKKMGLKLVVSTEEPFYIGLASSILGSRSRTVLTAWGSSLSPESGYSLTEVVPVGHKAEKVAAVWVPVRERKYVGVVTPAAVETEENPESFIV